MLSTPISSSPSKSIITSGSVGKKKPRPKRTSNKKKTEGKSSAAAPSVKIPESKKDASQNWKLLLSQRSSELSAKKKETEKPKFHLRRDVVRHKKQLMENKSSVACSSSGEGKDSDGNSLKNATENLHISSKGTDSNQIQNEEKKASAKVQGQPLPPIKGLNILDCFDYTHYGHLRTQVLPEHSFLTEPTPALGIDCEMVGVGPLKEDALARVSIVNEFGYCLYDKFVKPKSEVTDYRTEFSGVREEDLKKAENFVIVMKEVADLIKGHVLVGHSLKSDFDVLFLKHNKSKIRDTSFYYRKRFKKQKTPSLKGLVKDFLKVEIQTGEHNSITDAQAAMKLYLFLREEWEKSICKKQNIRLNKYWLVGDYRRAFQALGWKVK